VPSWPVGEILLGGGVVGEGKGGGVSRDEGV
jgi:hypothetical protein